jgi:hypothetical protein
MGHKSTKEFLGLRHGWDNAKPSSGYQILIFKTNIRDFLGSCV